MMTARLLLLRWAVCALGVYVTGVLGFLLPQLGGMMTLPLLPSGIAASLVYRWGPRMWPAVLAGSAAIDLSLHQDLFSTTCIAAGLVAGALLFARILHAQGFDPDFSRANDIPLFGIAALASMAVNAAIGVGGYWLAGPPADLSVHLLSWARWLANTTAGVLIVGPVLIGLSGNSLSRVRAAPLTALGWVAAAAACVLVMVLGGSPVLRAPMLVGLIVVVVIGNIRFGLVPAAIVGFALTVATAVAIAFNSGIFHDVSLLQGRALIWSVVLALSCVNLLVNALLAERDAAGLGRERAEQRYATIFNASPQPLWVHDPRTLRFVLVNDAAVRQYGYPREEFLKMGVAALAPVPGARVLPGSDDVSGGEPYETRHRARDGRILQVEVARCLIDYEGGPAELVFAADVTERRALGRALIDAIGNEQRRIGQEMHDGLGQELTGLSLSAQALATRARREGVSFAGALDQIAELAGTCIQSARNIVEGLSPLTDTGDSLEEALERLARRSSGPGVQVVLHARLDSALETDTEARVHLYRIAQEALQNALKHAQATRVDIDLWVRRGGVRLAVSDNGRGLASAPSGGRGLGMRTMRFRASAIGGSLRIGPGRSGGTTVVCEVGPPPALAAAG